MERRMALLEAVAATIDTACDRGSDGIDADPEGKTRDDEFGRAPVSFDADVRAEPSRGPLSCPNQTEVCVDGTGSRKRRRTDQFGEFGVGHARGARCPFRSPDDAGGIKGRCRSPGGEITVDQPDREAGTVAVVGCDGKRARRGEPDFGVARICWPVIVSRSTEVAVVIDEAKVNEPGCRQRAERLVAITRTDPVGRVHLLDHVCGLPVWAIRTSAEIVQCLQDGAFKGAESGPITDHVQPVDSAFASAAHLRPNRRARRHLPLGIPSRSTRATDTRCTRGGPERRSCRKGTQPR